LSPRWAGEPVTKRALHIAIIVLLLMAPVVSTGSATGRMVEMNVTNAEVRDVLTALAKVGGVNLVADDTVTGKVTVTLRNIPFEDALDIVTKIKGLTYYRIGDVIVVGSASQMGRSFGSVHIFKLQYANPADVRDILLGMLFNEGSAAGARSLDRDVRTPKGDTQEAVTTTVSNSSTNAARIKVDDATNAIVFYGSAAEAAQVRDILKQIDVTYQQVSLEAQVVEVSKNASKDLGVDWTWSELPKYAEREIDYETTTTIINGNTVSVSVPKETITRDKEDMVGTIRFGKSPTGLPYEFYYSAKISALVSKGDAKILAKPNITTLNGRKGHILIGDKIPVPKETTDNNRTTTTFEYQEAGIILDYTPRINDNGEITIDMKTSVSTPTLISSLKAYQISTREAETSVRLKDGETMVIGGLIGSQESGGSNKVPFFGDIPILGKLFQSVHKTKSETEVMVFVTARIVK
jgi:type IV pilus assembly protein PilQ